MYNWELGEGTDEALLKDFRGLLFIWYMVNTVVLFPGPSHTPFWAHVTLFAPTHTKSHPFSTSGTNRVSLLADLMYCRSLVCCDSKRWFLVMMFVTYPSPLTDTTITSATLESPASQKRKFTEQVRILYQMDLGLRMETGFISLVSWQVLLVIIVVTIITCE